jgi:putative addiction module component (TIGR02574 family)
MYTPTQKAMTPEIKKRLIEKLIQTEDDDLLKQVEAILESNDLSEEQRNELDRRMEKYRKGESRLYSLEEVQERISSIRKRA